MRSLLSVVRAQTPSRIARVLSICLFGPAILFALLVVSRSPASAAATCSLSATPANFSAEVAAASPGQTVCLASGNYGTWTGTNKAITIAAAPGNTPTMQISFGAGDGGFTLDGISGMTGTINGGAANIMIQNSAFAGQLDIEGATSNIVIRSDDFSYPVQSTSGGPNAKIFLATNGASPGSAVTIENNLIANGDLDGVHIGGGSGALVAGNEFENLCDRGVNHTDNIQFEGGSQIAIVANYVYEAQDCPTQGITSYDGHTNGILIEDNVVDVPRDWGIELYSDQNSVVVHNTVVWHPASYSEFSTPTGQIDIDRKSQDPAGIGTHVYDNIANVDFTNGSTGTQDHNVSGQRAIYVGPTNTWAGFKLAPSSPVGLHAASDGLDDGARVSAPPPSAPPSSPTPVQTGAGPTGRSGATRLAITYFSFSPRKFHLTRARGSTHHRAKQAAVIRFQLTVPAKVIILIARALPGRWSGGRCVRPRPRQLKHRSCTRYIVKGSVAHHGKSGRNAIQFSAILRGRRLPRGRYRARMVATASHPRRTATRTATFTVT